MDTSGRAWTDRKQFLRKMRKRDRLQNFPDKEVVEDVWLRRGSVTEAPDRRVSRAAPDLCGSGGYGFDAYMSLGINVNKVTAVLLADGWHEVADESFKLGPYEFLGSSVGQQQDGEPQLVHSAGANGICATGFQFAYRIVVRESEPIRKSMLQISGPLTAVLAVRTVEEA